MQAVKLSQGFYGILILGGRMMSESRLFKILYDLLDRKRAAAPELAAGFEVSQWIFHVEEIVLMITQNLKY